MPLRTSGEFSRVNYCVAKQLTPYVSLRVNKGGGAVGVECGVWMLDMESRSGYVLFALFEYGWRRHDWMFGIFSCRTRVPPALTFQREEGSR